MFDNIGYDRHERVVHVQDARTGLRAIIALHSTALGPAAGGCRLWSYENAESALTDALRLSRGMSYKNALAGLKMGGGKAVIMGPIPDEQRDDAFVAFGRAVDSLGGVYVTAEDAGVGVRDMKVAATQTKYVSGISAEEGPGGDPSPYTARGVRRAIEAVAKHTFAASSLEGLKIAVQGTGGVGGNLCKELSERGAKLIVADIDNERVDRICDVYSAERADVHSVLLADVDIISPCALGGALTEDIVNKLSAKAVVGGANNQLANDKVGTALFNRGIAYAPDYLVNSGGIIVAANEYFGTSTQDHVDAEIDKIYGRTIDVLHRSKFSHVPTNQIADHMAQQKIDEAAREAIAA